MIDILCRYDARDQQPVVFLRDTIQGDKIQVWSGKGNPQVMPLDYYKMTSPLSAEDERVLMERYKQATGKQDQQIRITHRLPRTSRPVPNLLAAPATGPAVNAQGENTQRAANAPRRAAGAKPLEQQALPSGPSGDLPQAGETLAPLPAATSQATAPAPAANETRSAALFRKIQELNQHQQDLNATINNLHTQLANATTDCEATKKAIGELKIELGQALDEEAAEELRKRKAMLDAITGGDDLQTAVQALHDAGTKQPDATPAPAQETPPAAPPKASNGSKAVTKAPAKSTTTKSTTTRKK